MRISDWSSDVCSSDLVVKGAAGLPFPPGADELDRSPDHARQRNAVPQFIQKGGGNGHLDAGGCVRVIFSVRTAQDIDPKMHCLLYPRSLDFARDERKTPPRVPKKTTPAPPSPVRLPGSCPFARRNALSAQPSTDRKSQRLNYSH